MSNKKVKNNEEKDLKPKKSTAQRNAQTGDNEWLTEAEGEGE